ncbi:MAG: hypothetical protein V3R24_08765 [Gemmatimonadales bacterium]
MVWVSSRDWNVILVALRVIVVGTGAGGGGGWVGSLEHPNPSNTAPMKRSG